MNKYLLFVINPFVSFLLSVKSFRNPDYRLIVLLFAIFFGFSYVPIPGSDATRYEYRISNSDGYTTQEYWNDLTNFMEDDQEYNDVYVYTVTYLLDFFTNDVRFYRAFFAFVYYALFISLLSNMLGKGSRSSNNTASLWFIGFLFLTSFTGPVNGVRWPLALLVVFYSVYNLLTTKHRKWLGISAIAPLIHFSTLYLVVFIGFWWVTKDFRKRNIWVALLVLTFVFQNQLSGLIGNNLISLESGITSKAQGYIMNEGYKEMRVEHLEKVNWYIKFDRYSTFNYCLIFFIALFSGLVKARKSQDLERLEKLVLLVFVATFLSGQLLDPISNRYYLAANGFSLMYFHELFKYNQGHISKFFRVVYIPILVLHILIIFRADLYTLNSALVLGPLPLLFMDVEFEGIQNLLLNSIF